MLSFVLWYLLTSLLGWLAFPLAYRLLPALPERGYAVSRALGLLLWGFMFWLLAWLGLLGNNAGGLLLALALLAGLSWLAARKNTWQEIVAWLRREGALVLTIEALFLIAFAVWAVVRAANPEAVGTEKPMELAFINAILASPTFPPQDPWLAGYSISYYYFGYVLTAMLAKFTATSGGVAFNLMLALVFALSATGAYSVVYNLLALYRQKPGEAPEPIAEEPSLSPSPASERRKPIASALLGPLFILLVSNLEGFLHSLHLRGLGWTLDPQNGFTSAFWRWLDIKDLNMPPDGRFTWIPDRFWWWWRASRVLQDYDLAGNPKEIINEFPFFSHLLGDLHPHVLAVPFAFLAISLALNLAAGGAAGQFSLWPHAWKLPKRLAFLHFHLHPLSFALAIVVLGATAFMNIWDFPFYVALFAAAYAWQRSASEQRPLKQVLPDFFSLAIALGICGILAYLPFYISFSSQAGGILPNLIYPTRGAHLWVMFAPLLAPILAYLLYSLRKPGSKASLVNGFMLAAWALVLLWAGALFLGFAISIIPQLGEFYMGVLGTNNIESLFQAALQRRLVSNGGWITMLITLTLTLAALLRQQPSDPSSNADTALSTPEDELPADNAQQFPGIVEPAPASASHAFALLLILLGALLVIGPEFFYLRDQFGWRMNTIFKFYYQAWLVWGLAAAFVSAILLQRLRRLSGAIFQVAWIALLVMSLVYPVFSLWNKTNGFRPTQWTLDSSAYLQLQNPDEFAAIEWLRRAPAGYLAEAVPDSGGSYTQFARFSTHTGKPAVLGWYGHESQWRGGGELLGPRQSDLQRLYCTRDWQETLEILERYQVRYVIVGGLERSVYRAGTANCSSGLQENKFSSRLAAVYKIGQLTIYENPIP
jgi:YYY domain-containing protein